MSNEDKVEDIEFTLSVRNGRLLPVNPWDVSPRAFGAIVVVSIVGAVCGLAYYFASAERWALNFTWSMLGLALYVNGFVWRRATRQLAYALYISTNGQQRSAPPPAVALKRERRREPEHQ